MSELNVDGSAARRYAGALFGSGPRGALVEVRFRVPLGMGRRFHNASRLVGAGGRCRAVVVGAHGRVRRRSSATSPRRRSGGCDRAGWCGVGRLRHGASAVALRVVSTRCRRWSWRQASGQHRHAYWFLREPVDLGSVERLNRRLALALGADAGVVTKPHTILRPAGSMNWKHAPPTPVRLVECGRPGGWRATSLTASFRESNRGSRMRLRC